MNFDSESKTMGVAEPIVFKPENSDFDHLDKIGPSYKGVKDKDKSYHVTICYWVKVIHKKQKI